MQDVLSGRAFSYTGERFAIERPEVTSIDTYTHKRENQDTAFTTRNNRTGTLAHEMQFKTKGWIYHPALSIYSLDFRPKFQTQKTEAAGAAKQRNEITHLGYTVDSTFLQYKPYTLNLSSSRSRSDTSSNLSPDFVTEAATDAARLYLKYDPLPTTFTLQQRSSETQAFFNTRNATTLARAESRHRTDQSDSFAQAEIAREEREIRSTSSKVDRFLLTGRNGYKFNDDLRLSSSLSTNRSVSRDSTSTNFTLSEGLAWKHAPNLDSRYDLRLARRTNEDFFSNTGSGSAGLTHLLYENLSTSFNTNASASEFTGGNTRSYGAGLDFVYRRRIPWGNITATNGYKYRIDDDKSDTSITQILDESKALTGINTTFLDSDNVDPASIVVTDAGGLVIFVENADYVVRVAGASVGIERTAIGSAIADGGTVLIDYSFMPNPPHKTDLKSVNFGVNLSLWRSLNLFYNIIQTEESLLSGTVPSSLASDTIQRAGTRLKWKWSTSSVEYEMRDTTRTPLNRLVARETVLFRPRPRLTAGGTVSYTQNQFQDTGNESTEINTIANAQWQPVPWADIGLRAFAGRVRGPAQRTERQGALALLQWRYGLWNGSVRAEFVHEDDVINDQSRDNQTLFFRVVRKLWQ